MSIRFDVANGVMEQSATGRYIEYVAHEKAMREFADLVVARFCEIESGDTASDAAQVLVSYLTLLGISWMPKPRE